MNQIKLTERLVTTMHELLCAREMETVMQIAQTTARELTQAQGSAFVLRDNDNCFYVDENADAPLWKGQRFPMKKCVSGWAMINKLPVVIEDIYGDQRIASELYKPTFVKSLAVVPVRAENPVGAIGVYWSETRTATDEELRLLGMLADGVAIAMDNINTCEELKNTIEELDLFTYKSAHDMRSPIASILGLAHLAEHDTGDPDTTREYVTKIKEQTERLDSVLQRLVETTRSRQGAKQITLVNFREIIDEVKKSLAFMKGYNGIHFDEKLESRKAFYSDRQVMTSIIQNLVDNAVKYRKDNNPDSYIRIRIVDTSNGVEITVSDNGIGIPENLIDGIFKMFFRATSKAQGSGLGLYTVNHSVRKLGGSIQVESTEGIGTTFKVQLPSQEMPA